MNPTPPPADPAPTDPRRRFLIQALALGWLGSGGWNTAAVAQALGPLPGRLPEGQSVFELTGEVWVNGRRANRATRIGPQDEVRTGDGGRILAVVGADAFLLRAGSTLQMGAGRGARRFFRLVTGAMLTVFGPRRDDGVDLRAPTATIGIRGTGVYLEADATKTYVCTCYGQTELSATGLATARETIRSRHHDAARYVYAEPVNGQWLAPAPFLNHDDLELMTLEALVGRQVPFALGERDYQGPRRDY